MGRVMSTAVNIGRTIARERRRRGVTQEALAAHLGVSKAAVSKWELGQSLPDVSLLPRIAAYFSLTLDELFDWHDELTAEESAALYAEVYALAERDLPAARERLRAIAAEHYSDASLLLMLASLLTLWAAGMATLLAPAGEKDNANGAPSDAADLTDDALSLLDRALEVATEPSTLYLAQQQRATVLFQAGRPDEAVALLEPLVRRQDAGAPTSLLASAYRELGRSDEALELLQTERLKAASFVLSSLMQEVGMRDDAAFAQAAGDAAGAVFEALDMGVASPFFPATMAFEVAEALRRAGEKDKALTALARAVDATESTPASLGMPGSQLWDRVAGRLNPARAGEAWAEHKTRQADGMRKALQQEAEERATSPEWRELAIDDPRYQEIVTTAEHLSNQEA